MTGLGDEVVTRCATCGYGLTARKYAIPRECPLCRGSFQEVSNHAPSDTQAPLEPESTEAAPGASEAAPISGEMSSPGETTSPSIHAANTSPLGALTQRMTIATATEQATETEPLFAPPDVTPPNKTPPDEEPPGEAYAPTAIQEIDAFRQTVLDVPEPKAPSPHEVAAHAPAAHTHRFEPPQAEPTVHTSAPKVAWVAPEPQAPRTSGETKTYIPTVLPPVEPPPPPQASPEPPPSKAFESGVAPRVMNRYADAYRVARTVVLIGNLIKIVGVLLGLFLGIALFALFASQARFNEQLQVVGFFIALLFGGGVLAFFFVLGVIVSSHGQMSRAALDGAVNGSPFLTNEQRAEVMSLL
jgi:hypothetical protein